MIAMRRGFGRWKLVFVVGSDWREACGCGFFGD